MNFSEVLDPPPPPDLSLVSRINICIHNITKIILLLFQTTSTMHLIVNLWNFSKRWIGFHLLIVKKTLTCSAYLVIISHNYLFFRFLNHNGDLTLTCRVIHSLPLLMSAIQVFYHDKMAAVGHVISTDQLPLSSEVCIIL